MKTAEFIKKELSNYKKSEIISLLIIGLFILYNAFYLKDNPYAVINAICGILYTFLAGKGKISCYFFGLMGSACYVKLSFDSVLWGNMLLYLCYYIPMQTLGIFKWKNNLKKDSLEIIKTKLNKTQRAKASLTGIIGCLLSIIFLYCFKDTSPVIDGITTFLSIMGMYFTVKRLIEQWIVWIIVNGLSFIMWLKIVLSGQKVYSTLVMWGVYFVLAIYFYVIWKKELKE